MNSSIPTVVGPRYSNLPADTSAPDERWVANPYLREDSEPRTDFSITMAINAGMDIAKVTSPSHDTTITFDTAQRAASNSPMVMSLAVTAT
ncbi:MAG: hypothetical protein JKP90_00400 [Desulfofustis sp. PB-SRB1]|nr:hypothetical protein [Desulfofustis sp. PB-SRB1]